MARSFSFPLPCCRRTSSSLDLKLGRVLDRLCCGLPAGWVVIGVGTGTCRALLWRWHCEPTSEGHSTSLAPHVCFSTSYGWVACHPVPEAWAKWGRTCSAALPCSLGAEYRKQPSVYGSCGLQLDLEQQWIWLQQPKWNLKIQNWCSDGLRCLWPPLYTGSSASWLNLKTTNIIWTLSSSASTEAGLNLWTWLSLNVIAVMHGNLWVGCFQNHGLIPQLQA